MAYSYAGDGATMTHKSSEEFEKFDKAMDKIMSVSKSELDKRLAAAKKVKIGKRYPKQEKISSSGS